MPRRRYAARTTVAAAAERPSAQLELLAVREILNAVLHADRPEAVFQFALDRVSPLVRAGLAAIHLVEGESDIMRLVAAHGWPHAHGPLLDEMRVGSGPGGEAVIERRTIEVPDVLDDPGLPHWHAAARELAFRGVVAMPLQSASRVLGAATFCFAEPGGITAEQRGLLRLVADQMAVAAEKAALVDDLRRTGAALAEANAELERQFAAATKARRLHDELLAGLLAEPGHGTPALTIAEFDPRVPLREAIQAMQAFPGRPRGVDAAAFEPVLALPPMRSDRGMVIRVLVNLLAGAFARAAGGSVRASVDVANGRVLFDVQDTGQGGDPEPELGLALARGLAQLLGGGVECAPAPGQGTTCTLNLPLQYVRPEDRP